MADLRLEEGPGTLELRHLAPAQGQKGLLGPPGEPRLGIPYGARTEKEGRDHVRELHARGVHFVKIWVDDRNGRAPRLSPALYRAVIVATVA
jgi:hypothetical protein